MMLEVRIIMDNVKRYGGFREKEILKDLVKIEIVMDDERHKVYKFENKEGFYFEYDFKSHLIVG